MPIALAISSPSIPYVIGGEVTINGEPAPDNVDIDAYINGVNYASDLTEDGYYLLSIPGDDPDTSGKQGGVNGDLITIKINGETASASPTPAWRQGSEVVDITLETDNPPQPPPPPSPPQQPENHAPGLNYIPDITATEGDLITINPSASDQDDDTLTFSFTSPLNSNGEWQTEDDDAGTYTTTVTVSDGELTDTQDVQITVEQVQDNPPDAPPYTPPASPPVTPPNTPPTNPLDHSPNPTPTSNYNDLSNPGYSEEIYTSESQASTTNYVEPEPTEKKEKSKEKSKPLELGTIRQSGSITDSAAGEDFGFGISLKNTNTKKIKNIKVSVTVSELGIASEIGPFTLKKGESLYKTIQLPIPEDTDYGEYFAKVTIKNNNHKTVKYRRFYIE
tara:strand:+ start:1438 stop:2610 length:1173 start_codon:yes stop_codon:yes gene_type:complete